MQMQTVKPNVLQQLRRAVAWLAMALAFLLPFNPSGIRLTISEPVTTETTVFHFTIHNRSHRTLSYGLDDFYIEEQTDSGWKQVEKADHAVIEILVMQGPEDRDFLVDLQTVYGGPLAPGTYRLTFCCNAGNMRSGKPATASVQFTVE